ncbi:MAG: hypothetical protein KDJ98_14450 [Rhodobacteraceae bacterium]|nr:hypothetical protein [Paracoccaceae bacterium]
MKICIVGNSHVGSLQRAWTAWPEAERPAVTLTAFAARHRLMDQADVIEGRLVAGTDALRESFRFTSGGADEADLAAYDAILLYGLFVPAYRGNGARCSRACQTAAFEDHFDPRLGIGAARKIRQGTRAPVLIGHDPLMCDPEAEAADPAPGRPGDAYAVGIRLANGLYFRRRGLEILEQPAATRVGPGGHQTRAALSKGSRRLAIGDKLDDREHGDGDQRHMNEDFGRAYLDMLFARLGAAARG